MANEKEWWRNGIVNYLYLISAMVIDQSKLKQWSKNTIDCYLEQVLLVGENIATSFYNQSDLSKVKDCELMIIGINPGCGIYYSQWGLKEYVKSNPDFLYKGNPCFEGKSDEVIVQELSNDWALWKKMHRMLNYSGKGELLEHLDRFILTNMIFFGTDKENQIPKGINKEKCAEQTRKLIDDIEPKVVILLGKQSRELFIRISKVKFDELVPNSVYHCIYNKSHVLAIKHTAYHYSNVEMEVVGKTIGYVLDHHDETINKETIYSS